MTQFQGVGVALITPFKKDKSIDFDALAKLIDHVINGGVDFLVALGTTAETPTLSAEEKLSILNFVIQHNNKRRPIVVGIGGNNTHGIIETIRQYPMDQVDGILSVVPYYNRPSQEGMFQHFSAIAQATDKNIILYNVPGRTASNILPETVVRLAKAHSNIVAIKEASGNLPQCMEIVRNAPASFSVLSGDDNLILSQIAIGMKGVISVAANCYPQTFCDMVHQALNGDIKGAQPAFYQLLPAIHLLFAEGNPCGVKYACSQKGISENELRLPMISATEQLQNQFNSLPDLK